MSRAGAVEAYVVVQAEHGSAAAALAHVRSLEEVIDAQIVSGPSVSNQKAFR
jgi:hypothetical protein